MQVLPKVDILTGSVGEAMSVHDDDYYGPFWYRCDLQGLNKRFAKVRSS